MIEVFNKTEGISTLSFYHILFLASVLSLEVIEKTDYKRKRREGEMLPLLQIIVCMN